MCIRDRSNVSDQQNFIAIGNAIDTYILEIGDDDEYPYYEQDTNTSSYKITFN